MTKLILAFHNFANVHIHRNYMYYSNDSLVGAYTMHDNSSVPPLQMNMLSPFLE